MAMSRNEPPCSAQELDRRRVRVARCGPKLLDPPQLPGRDEFARARVARIEPAHEPHLDREAGIAPEIDDASRRRQVLGDRLLGPHRLAGAQGSLDQRRVAVRRRDDDDGLDVRVVDRVEGIGRGAARLRELAAALGRFGHRIRDDDDAGVGDAGDGAEVGEAHAPSAQAPRSRCCPCRAEQMQSQLEV